MLLSYEDLIELINDGVIDSEHSHANGASIDLTLGGNIFVEDYSFNGTVDIETRNSRMKPLKISPGGFHLAPGQFILAETQQTFNLPDNVSALYVCKSSMARAGLNHLNAGYADPTWHGSKLTLELVNMRQYSSILLREGMKIGQMLFFLVKPVPLDKSYSVRGQYNNTVRATPNMGVR